MPDKKYPLQLQIICHNLPPTDFKGMPASRFGLQDKNGVLDAGQPLADNTRLFSCVIEAKITDEKLDFSGIYVQGKKSARFLYLSWAYDTGSWVQRIKIPLTAITYEQVISGNSLQAIIENSCTSGTVKPKDSWKTV